MLKAASKIFLALALSAGPSVPAGFASTGVEARFVPPASRKAVRGEFWETIFRLERKHAAFESVNGRGDLVEGIRDDLGRLSPRQRTDTMLRFLRISFHYRGKTDESAKPEEREAHARKFMEEVRAFSDKAQREYLENKNDTYIRIFANVRSLAAAGSEGLRLSQELSRADPQNSLVQGNLAQDYLNAGELKSAVEASQRAISLDPTDAAAFTTLASARYSSGDYRGAHEAASSALLIEPGDKVAYSIMKLTRGRFDSGRAKEEDSADSLPVLAFDFKGGEAQAKDAVATLPGGARSGGAAILAPAAFAESKALADQARAQIRRGDYRRAIDLSTRALAKNPQNTAALFRRAHAKYRLKAYDEALADTQEALRVMGGKPSPILLLLHARVLNSLSRFEDALGAADLALSESPESSVQAKLLFQKSWALGGLGRREDALHILAQAARLDGAYIPYYQEALELPSEGDWTVLFANELAAETSPYSGSEEGKRDGGRHLIFLIAMTLLGGFLVALGLLQVVAARQSPSAVVVGLAPPDSGLIGGAYRVQRKIGVGGMGVVYQAMDVNLERPVAIKRMREEISGDARERERFLSEARTVAKLRHPNIVEIHSVVSDGSDVYLVFELIDGHTVSDYVRHYSRLEYGPALRILEATAAALSFAHRQGVVHRDLKPSNIMITRDGVVKVMDFGVARQAKDSIGSLAVSMTVSGTPPYMAPEQEQGKTCPASDVFALAVCFYEMLTGELPFNGTGGGMALAKAQGSYLPAGRLAPNLPEGADAVISWALEPDAGRRCPSPEKFVESLKGLRA